jgi:hypoxanthine phosphoribosyltransferase
MCPNSIPSQCRSSLAVLSDRDIAGIDGGETMCPAAARVRSRNPVEKNTKMMQMVQEKEKKVYCTEKWNMCQNTRTDRRISKKW